jgi:ribosomal protein L11 methyltransferase
VSGASGDSLCQLVLTAGPNTAERASDALIEVGALSATIEDADTQTGREQPLFDEPGVAGQHRVWQRSTITALFNDEVGALSAAAIILAQDWAQDLHVRALEAVPARDWIRAAREQFTPVEITASFWIVPSWHGPPPGARLVIRLDPGLAFGTGSHPTTRMCLRWLAAHAQPWSNVLDYGCGSGILAIAAALLGARRVCAVDIDPAAVAATKDNANANGVTIAAGGPESAAGQYAVVLANILAAPLKLLAPVLAGRVAAGGDLLLTGILERQVDELRAAYAPWLAIDVADSDDGWVLMRGRMASSSNEPSHSM